MRIGVPTTCADTAASGTPADTLPMIVAPWVEEDGPPVLLGPAGACGASPPQAKQPNATNVSTPIHRDIRMALPPVALA